MTMRDYKTLTTAEIREDFLKFFESKGCRLYPSSSLIPDDPSLLLTNAGMNQFKEYYQGLKTMDAVGACSCQKCLRTNDIDAIGDARHLSFFEMLGNFSFGGYSKRDAIAWAWEFISSPEHLGLPQDRLYMTVFEDDDEAIELWHEMGVAYDHISRLGEEDNFWAAGPTGPCGPCSEIYFDQGPEHGCGSDTCAPGCDCDRFLEFWNLVFTQYDRQEDGSLPELPHRNVDTGMGLERIAAIMQHRSTNYDGDLLQSLIAEGVKLSGKTYGLDATTDKSLRILADHGRAVTFMIADGILPSNEGRGYVLRRLLRRAVYHGRLLGIEGFFLTHYTAEVIRLMGDDYTNLVSNRALIERIVAAEEERFVAHLTSGQESLNRELDQLDPHACLAGSIAFKLHDTYGFPIDLTREIVESRGFTLDMAGFEAAMNEQKERARASACRDAWSSSNDVWTALSGRLTPTKFVGYEQDEADQCTVIALVAEGHECERASAGSELEVVLDVTPFYAEMGGQCADMGTLTSDTVRMTVLDVQPKNGFYAHMVRIEAGELVRGDMLLAQISSERRSLIRRNHTATHLLHAALKEVLGDHVSQAGSQVAPDRLRFDFTHFEALTKEQLERIEGIVNYEIFKAHDMRTTEMSLDEARTLGATALFGEKYGDRVRVVSTGDPTDSFSCELCGGTHVHNTAEIGMFKIVSESSVGSNARRIEATTSMGALHYVDEQLVHLSEAAAALKCQPQDLAERIAQLAQKLKHTEAELKDLRLASVSQASQGGSSEELACNGYTCVVAELTGLNPEELREYWDQIRTQHGHAIACVLFSRLSDDKVALLASATADAVEAGFHAGNLVKELAGELGGRGGGRPNMAQAGGSDPSGIERARARVAELIAR